MSFFLIYRTKLIKIYVLRMYVCWLCKWDVETGESSEIYSESSEILKDLKVSPWVVLGVLVSPRVHISMRRVPGLRSGPSPAVITFVRARAPRGEGHPNHFCSLVRDTKVSRLKLKALLFRFRQIFGWTREYFPLILLFVLLQPLAVISHSANNH